VGQAVAGGLQFVEAIQHAVARDDGDLGLPAAFGEFGGKDRGGALRVEPAGIQKELHSVLPRRRPQRRHHRHQVARISGARILHAVLLQDRQGQFGQMIGADVLHFAARQRGSDRRPGVAVEAQTRTNAHSHLSRASDSRRSPLPERGERSEGGEAGWR